MSVMMTDKPISRVGRPKGKRTRKYQVLLEPEKAERIIEEHGNLSAFLRRAIDDALRAAGERPAS